MTSSSRPLGLENVVSKTLESDGATKHVGHQQQPAQLGWGMSLNRLRSTESSPSSSILTTSREDSKTEIREIPVEGDEEQEEEGIIHTKQLPPHLQGLKREQVGGSTTASGAAPATTVLPTSTTPGIIKSS